MGRRNRKEIIDQEEIGVYHCYNSAAQGLRGSTSAGTMPTRKSITVTEGNGLSIG